MISDAVGRAPAEQGQVVAHRLGQVAPVAEVGDGDVVAALRQLLALLVDEERQVGEDRLVVEAEGVDDQQVLRRAVDVVLAADHVGDAHERVVDRVGEQEHRRAVRAEEDEVLEGGVGELDVAADEVVEAGRAVVGGAEAQRPPVAGLEAPVAAAAVVARRAAALLGPRLDVLGACSRSSRRGRRGGAAAAAST